MRGCFEPKNPITAVNGKCHTSDVKCTANKLVVCIESRQQCDINIDCDNKEDEMVNCGKCVWCMCLCVRHSVTMYMCNIICQR